MTGIGLKKPYKTRSQFKKKIPYISLQCECFVHKLKVQKKKKNVTHANIAVLFVLIKSVR